MLARTGLAALSGMLLAGAYAPFDVPWVIPVAVAAYVVSLDRLPSRRAWLPGLAFGLGFQLTLLWWMRVIGTDAWAGLAGFEALFYAALATFSLFAGGAALAADACCCCKDGAKMECCDKMKDKGAAKPSDAKPAQPEHKH